MSTIQERAEAYEPERTKTIADLEAVSVTQVIKDVVKKNKDNEEYKAAVINVEGVEYRVPNSVLEQIQSILKEKPDMKTFKVERKGEGLNSKYTVIQLE